MRTPSDIRAAVQAAIGPQAERYRSALATATGEVESALARARGASANGSGRAAAELGRFAAGRIDADRFATLFDSAPTLDANSAAALARAHEVLVGLQAAGDALFTVELATGDALTAAAERTLAAAGRAFGAARAAELARGGRYRPAEHAALFEPLPFHLWTRAERRLAPPLVITLNGADVAAAGLADLLDGAARIVLVVAGVTSPAPLARLVTPDVFVLQTADPAALDALARCDGPAIALLVAPDDADAALFRHDPAAGSTLATRLLVERLPERVRPGAQFRASHFQRTQELELLRVLATQAAAGASASLVAAAAGARAAAAGPAAADPPAAPTASTAPSQADRLAAWLLRQGELAGDAS